MEFSFIEEVKRTNKYSEIFLKLFARVYADPAHKENTVLTQDLLVMFKNQLKIAQENRVVLPVCDLQPFLDQITAFESVGFITRSECSHKISLTSEYEKYYLESLNETHNFKSNPVESLR